MARDLELTQPTAWYKQRIRSATKQSRLQGIVEADETYLGGKPRKANRRADATPAPRGRGTKKTAVIGAVERGGQVVVRVASDLTGRSILRFIRETVTPGGSLLISDEFRGYRAVKRHIQHAVINHSRQYVDGALHTNHIEGVWALLKRAWYGSHHHYSRAYTPLYLAEAGWKYNVRKAEQPFADFLRGAVAV